MTRKAGGSQDSGQGSVSSEESERRFRNAQRLMPIPSRRTPMPMPPGLEGQDRLMPPAGNFEGQAGQSVSDGLRSIMPFLQAPGKVARGAVEGGMQAINPDFQMPFMRGGGQEQRMPLPRSFDPGTDAILRAIIARMQGGM
jgi:hypothetical protein